MLVPLSLLTADPQTFTSFSTLPVGWMWREKKCVGLLSHSGKAGTLFHALVAKASAHVNLLSAISGDPRMQ